MGDKSKGAANTLLPAKNVQNTKFLLVNSVHAADPGSETFCEIWIQPKQIELSLIFIESEYDLCRLLLSEFCSIFKKVREVRTRLSF
jgi:hypothetical protein